MKTNGHHHPAGEMNGLSTGSGNHAPARQPAAKTATAPPGPARAMAAYQKLARERRATAGYLEKLDDRLGSLGLLLAHGNDPALSREFCKGCGARVTATSPPHDGEKGESLIRRRCAPCGRIWDALAEAST